MKRGASLLDETILTLETIPRMTREMEVDYVYKNLVKRCEINGIPPPSLPELMVLPEMKSIWEDDPPSPPSSSIPPPSPQENIFRRILGTIFISDPLIRTDFNFQGVLILGTLTMTLSEIISL